MAINGVLLDIAGVLYDGDTVVPSAVKSLRALRAAGLPLRLVTNTSRRPKRVLLDQLRNLGFDVSEDEVFTATEALVAHLVRERLRPFLLVHSNLDEEFETLDPDRPNAVVVAESVK